ncbi:NlpC/P60 family protein [uncultured Algimonas sp.]|uniref:C40 family peptidase n=1 Tax=uncultured Algimonas sp. TaxID=1547920 RepID=UPI00260D83A8|nr:NlpC/P60 family protein [uncultured Algimonas sp.]
MSARDTRIRLPNGTGPKLARRRVVADFAPLLSDPKPRAPQLSELVHGQDFDIHVEQGRWAFGRARPLVTGGRRKGYTGWIEAARLGEPSGRHTHVVTGVSAPVFCRADLKSHILMSVPMGSRVAVMDERDGYSQIGAGAWLSRLHLRRVCEPETDWIAVARRMLGQPYVWGGNGARGVDCSGLVQMSLSVCGVDAPRDADLQEVALGEPVDAPDRPGDLLFWPGHVGVMATKTRLLHANATHMAVVEEPLGPALRRMEKAGVRLRAVKRF